MKQISHTDYRAPGAGVRRPSRRTRLFLAALVVAFWIAFAGLLTARGVLLDREPALYAILCLPLLSTTLTVPLPFALLPPS